MTKTDNKFMSFIKKTFNNFLTFVKKNKVDLVVYFGFLAILCLLIVLAVGPQYKFAVANNKEYSPVAFSIFGLEVAWYAIFILSGIILAGYMAFLEFKKLGWDTEDLLDGLLIIAPLSIVGARIYYVIFDWPGTFWGIFDIRSGGLAIHGAIIVATIGVIIFSKVKKLDFFSLVDVLAVGFLIGQIAGRWGNFMNAEAHGRETALAGVLNILPNFIKHQMSFSSYDGNLATGFIFQPTFLYESLWNLGGLTILFILRRKKVFKTGDMLGFYLIWYGFGRGVLVEPFRTDQLLIFGLPVNIIMSLALFVGGGILFLILKRVLIKGDQPYYNEIATVDVKFFKKNEVKEEINV